MGYSPTQDCSWASLPSVLIFSNKLLSKHFLFSRLDPKAARVLRQRLSFAQLLRGAGGEVGQQRVSAAVLQHRLVVGAPQDCRVWNRLLIIADAAAEISVGPGYQAYPRNGRVIGARPWQHIAYLGDLTFRLLNRRVDFRAKRPAGRVLSGAHVGASASLRLGLPTATIVPSLVLTQNT